MVDLIVLNIVGIFCASALGVFLIGGDWRQGEIPRWFAGLWAAWAATWLSLLGWGFVVAVHFINKWW